jgi:hypothetical protein
MVSEVAVTLPLDVPLMVVDGLSGQVTEAAVCAFKNAIGITKRARQSVKILFIMVLIS